MVVKIVCWPENKISIEDRSMIWKYDNKNYLKVKQFAKYCYTDKLKDYDMQVM